MKVSELIDELENYGDEIEIVAEYEDENKITRYLIENVDWFSHTSKVHLTLTLDN